MPDNKKTGTIKSGESSGLLPSPLKDIEDEND